jgi:2-oxoglutarate dehydrogenase E2 component (dihydrolipoamide succinyltransferase)
MAIEIRVPQLPESVADATLVTWHKQAGQSVSRDENLADLETDKVVLEVPAPVNGILKELKIGPGTSVTSGQLLAVLEEGAAPAVAPAKAAAPAAAPAAPAPAAKAVSATAPASGNDKLAPSVRRMVEEKQLDPATMDASPRATWSIILICPPASRQVATSPPPHPLRLTRAVPLRPHRPSAPQVDRTSACP